MGQQGMEILRRFVGLQVRKKELDAELKQVKAEISDLEPAVLDFLQESGVQNINIDKHTIYIARDIHASFLGTERAVEVLGEQGMDDALKLTVHPSRASSIVREILMGLDIDQEPPTWLDDAFSYVNGYKVGVRSSK